MARLCKLKEHSLSSYPNRNNNTISQSLAYTTGGEKCWSFFLYYIWAFFFSCFVPLTETGKKFNIPSYFLFTINTPMRLTTIGQLLHSYVLSSISQQFLLLKMVNISLLLHTTEFHLFLWKLLQFNILPYFSTLIYLETSQHSISKVVNTYDHLPWVWPLQSNILSLCASVTSGFLPSPEFWKASLEAIVRLEAEHERPHFVPTVPFTPSAAHFTLSLHSHYKKKIPKKVIYI